MINYKQLHYFWRVAKEGGITRASEYLHLTPQTLSGQISLLESTLGVSLFRRVGRRLELTDMGELALSYADEIFRAGAELEEVLRSNPGGRPLLFRVGIADVVPKSIAYRLLAPAMELPEPPRLVCREDKLERLLAELAIHRLDMVLADSPMPAGMSVKGYSHLLGEYGVTFLATPELAATLSGDFPACLDAAPLLLPGEDRALRGPLLQWLGGQGIRPRLVGEFEDSALMQAFGQAGRGVFPLPSALEAELGRGLHVLGRSEAIRDRYYAISVERRISHPAVALVCDAARALAGK
jgi:LysR family transcriptional regulator, transcriptional activator of nhaA